MGIVVGEVVLNIWHYDSTQWVKLSTSVYTNPKKACAYTSSFSAFAVGMDVAPPEASVAEISLPVTGGYSPNAIILLFAMFAGVAMVGAGLVAVRRARNVGENS